MKYSCDCKIEFFTNDKKILSNNIQMVKLEDYTAVELKKMIKSFNGIVKFGAYSKLKKAEIINMMKSHPKIKIQEGANAVKISVVAEQETPVKEKKEQKEQKPEVAKKITKTQQKAQQAKVIAPVKKEPQQAKVIAPVKKEPVEKTKQTIKQHLKEFDNAYLLNLIEKKRQPDYPDMYSNKDAEDDLKKYIKQEGIKILEDYLSTDEFDMIKKDFGKKKDFYAYYIKQLGIKQKKAPVKKKEPIEPMPTKQDLIDAVYNTHISKIENGYVDSETPPSNFLEALEEHGHKFKTNVSNYMEESFNNTGATDAKEKQLSKGVSEAVELLIKKDKFGLRLIILRDETLKILSKQDENFFKKPNQITDPKLLKKNKSQYKKLFETYKKSYGDLLDKYGFSKSEYRKTAQDKKTK